LNRYSDDYPVDFDTHDLQAIAYLITNENYYIEAVHFSIALAYYGLLRQADEASFTGEELRKIKIYLIFSNPLI